MSRAELKTIEQRLAAERGPAFRPGPARVALLYPSPYRAGMSSLGFQWIHGVLADAGFAVERAFLPDDVEAWRRSRAPLVTYESKTPLSRFPAIGVSLAYELELSGLIQALELAGIPPLRRDRTPGHPRIVLGGPLTFSNPLPAAPFVDLMLLGEAEEQVADAMDAALQGGEGWLDACAALPGAFIPERDGARLPPVAKASDALLPARSRIVTADAALSEMFLIEGERGCHRACTFCVMRRSTNGGMRLVTPERVLSFVPDYAPRVGLVGAAISDHPKLPQLVDAIVESGRGVGVSSLRADRIALKPHLAASLRRGGYKTLTVASDAASQRLRRQISKGTTGRHLMRCAEIAAELDYRVLKIYMMLGVPGETPEDVDELIDFTLELAKIHPVSLGVAPFVPKRNTPMDADAFAGIKPVERQIRRLERGLRPSRGRAEVRPTSARWAWVEYMLAQGGPEAGAAALEATRAGGRFADWRRAFKVMDPATMSPWRVERVAG